MHHTTSSDLVTFKAPGPRRAPGEPIPRITIAPMVCLVDIHGDPVPDCERHVPTCPPDPTDPMDWGPETDNFYWEPGPSDEDLAAAAAALDDLPFPDAPDADPMIRFPGVASLADRLGIAPIAGGSPVEDLEPFTPSAEDLADYSQWAAELDARRDQIDFYARHPLAEFNSIRTD